METGSRQTCSFAGRAQHDFGPTSNAILLVGKGKASGQGNADHIVLGVYDSLSYAHGNLLGRRSANSHLQALQQLLQICFWVSAIQKSAQKSTGSLPRQVGL